MKIQNHIPIALLATFIAATSALHADSTQNKLPFPMPEFMSQSQVVAWQKDRIAKADAARASQAAASQPSTTDSSSSAFYTGKPYLAESGSYAFKYREYNPEMNRWTTVDPSGFPDGANNRVYAGAPVFGLDPDGLSWTFIASTDNGSQTQQSNGSVGGPLYQSSVFATANLQTKAPTSGPGVSSTSVTGGSLGHLNGQMNNITSTTEGFTVSIDESGNLAIALTGGSWQNFDGDLSIASTYSVSGAGTRSLTLNFSSSSAYNPSGVSGAGVAGGSISWTGGSGVVNANTSITFTAKE